jgi:hypothetical protein
METADVDVGGVGSSETGTTNGAVRIAFDSPTKIITTYYDTDVLDGYQWVEYGSFGIAGSGGTNVTTDWHLTDTDQFTAYIYGYSSLMVITSGQMYGDDFQQEGGVTPTGGPSPVPTGSFGFRFPTNNPLLTAIASMSGNYHGVSPTDHPRDYNLDVAQDEAGKLAVMGTVTGITKPDGGSELAGNIGSVATVNDMPTAKLKGGFAGVVDGTNSSAKGAAAPMAWPARSAGPARLPEFRTASRTSRSRRRSVRTT